jgi:hypothetical protein
LYFDTRSVHLALFHLAEISDSKARAFSQEALEALGVYSHHQLHNDVHHACGIQVVHYLCRCNDLRAQRIAASVLQTVLENPEHRMSEADFRTVLKLATSPNKELQTYVGFAVLTAIEFLMFNPGVVAALVSEGQVVPSLVQLVCESVHRPGSCTHEVKLLAAHVITQWPFWAT